MSRTQPILKIYGERNTGTNYLSNLIALNFSVRLLPGVVPTLVDKVQAAVPGESWVKDLYFRATQHSNLGWKHSFVPAARLDKRRCVALNGFITLTKNPYSWLLSLYKRPYHSKQGTVSSFEDFLKTRWETVARENASNAYRNPVDIWNSKNSSYLKLATKYKTKLLKYENLLAIPEESLEEIGSSFGLPRKSAEWLNVEGSTKQDDRSFSGYQDYYLNERWRQELSPKVIEFVNSQLDDHCMAEFGYGYL